MAPKSRYDVMCKQRILDSNIYCKLISGCVRIACSDLMITSLLQVANLMFTDLMQLDEVNRLDTTCWQNCIRPIESTTCIKSVAFSRCVVQQNVKTPTKDKRQAINVRTACLFVQHNFREFSPQVANPTASLFAVLISGRI